MFKLQNKQASQCLKPGALGVDVSVTNHPATLQKRVYSLPIWYTP